MPQLTASQIAAQAAMQHQSMSQHVRKRSQTVPNPQSPPDNNNGGSRKPLPLQMQPPPRKPSGNGQYYNGSIGGYNATAATAAAAAFPRSTAQLSPGRTTFEQPAEKEHKLRTERSKMKLFSKPKHIGISSYKDADRKDRPLHSPTGKATSPGPSMLSKASNISTASLVDAPFSSASSLYSTANTSTSTLVPLDRQRMEEKEKAHKHNFLSRQKHKLKDKIDDHALTLSSASSNSRPADPSAPQSLYNFAPVSPGPSVTSFSKSVSGLDLRHGGRALREKKKEDKASIMPILESRRPDVDRADWAPSACFGSSTGHSFLGPVNTNSTGGVHGAYNNDYTSNLQGFGLSNMRPEDAWDFLKAKLLIVFERGEELQILVEDLNRLVSVHIHRCIQRNAPTILNEDLRDLLHTGFLSLEHTLRGIPDDRLVPHLVEMWLFVFGTILPKMQAVFLPLDLEFKGHGTIMTSTEAAEFWGVQPEDLDDPFTNELDVRRIVLISYRDKVILPMHDILKAIFSRPPFESINAVVDVSVASPGLSRRPGTAGSLDPGLASFNSQGSTLLDGSISDGARSRAVSNTSAPELPSFVPPPARVTLPPDSAQVTETVGRMLQCLSVLVSVQTGDDAQSKMESLAKELKLNWLGRGRTGRNRKGFVGTRVMPIRHASEVEVR